MSLVTTPSCREPASSRHSSAIRELLPVPTGPQTPSRRARVGGCWWSGTEQPPGADSVGLCPGLDLRSAGGRDGVGRGERGDLGGQAVYVGQGVEDPAGDLGGIQRQQLEG